MPFRPDWRTYFCSPILLHTRLRPGTITAKPPPPSVPLVTHDPYFSIWSGADKLTDSDTRHWTGKAQTLSSLVRVDGETFRLMGSQPVSAPSMEQTAVRVLPTRTIYDFASKKLALSLTFTTPVLPADLPVLSRPVTYLTFSVRSLDGAAHTVQLYADASAELAVNQPSQPVIWNRAKISGLTALRIGSKEQAVLAKRGDDLRIDWGYLYLAAPQSASTTAAFASRAVGQAAWTKTGKLPTSDDIRQPPIAERRPAGRRAGL